MGKALDGVRILDFTHVQSGPTCTQLLAWMGADVVKVERPGEGDDTRHWGPPYLQDAQGKDTDQASYFACTNRNKRSLTLNLSDPQGQALVRQMAQRRLS